MFKTIKFLVKLALSFMKKEVVNKEDYRTEYNKVSRTYGRWLDKMSRFTDEIVMPLESNQTYKILDFACGTGYITRKLLEKNANVEIAAVDYSENMLEHLRLLKNDKVSVVHSDGIKFLESANEKFDVVFFGWALPYFNHKKLFPLFKKVMKAGGKLGIICNVEGTLSRLEDIFLKVMYNNQDEIAKPMSIGFNLPAGSAGLENWLKKYGFEKVKLSDGEVKVSFERAEDLLDWLNETGAAAGTKRIFKEYEKIREDLIEAIKIEKRVNEKYEINHKFAYGIFKLP
ncbi:MAG TPA: class I SAM-dependent methyltransferase [Spirochaetota bacterium]|mgnify:FL=1|jgi:ubiquinone/menaquinone biosynthesis C-methylase UbiE|nr:MAG: ubiquinone/menaquinone biosynthesis methyltransferase [Spirochaetes bacterium ADurb.Bin133]HNZ27736.1 class I SAM-dependent methyltransferase [Spirochaetota bacterium]HPY87582.1 class I SAM-dependent methyltransferase [Spirochaetota bacterium]HQB60471.1 class I SAM-dependent methyltransferase [Spirochaetota bacterium]